MARQKKETAQKSVDEVRGIILKFFYDVHKKASSPKKIRLKILEVKSGLKAVGIDSKEAISNIDYLIGGGWIVKEEETRQITTRCGAVSSKTITYKASNKTIDHFEGPSKFQKPNEGISGINITNVHGITSVAVGDSNHIAVNTKFLDLHRQLDLLSNAISKSAAFTDEQKLNQVADINTIKAQLMRPEPDKSIIRQAWERLSQLATAAGVIDFFQKVAPLIKELL